jgi:O-antigen biosynthesis protein
MTALRRFGAWLARRRPQAAWVSDSLLLVAGRLRRGADLRAEFGDLRLYECSPADSPRVTVVPLESLIAARVRPLRDGGRALMRALLEGAGPHLEGRDGLRVAKSLRAIRDAARGELRPPSGEHGAALAVNVDAINAIDERAFWVFGWVNDPRGLIESMEAVSPEGQRVELLEGAFRYARPDVAELHAAAGGFGQLHGFHRYFVLPYPSRLRAGWRVEVTDAAQDEYEVNAPAEMTDNPPETRLQILREFAAQHAGRDGLRRELGHPALERLQRRLRRTVGIGTVDQYGDPPVDPVVTVIVPLYKRIDFVEHQLAQFGRDPELRAADLVYVLDSPELAPELDRAAAPLSELHGVAFRIARTTRNAGYATANNLATELAQAQTLLLLNSDVIPAAPGWLGRLHAFQQATADIGALGPKLLFEDESIQHAGMYFERLGETGLWANRHYFKGFSRTVMGANVTRPVPAVTAACMMVERGLYQELGGLSDSYVEGGYEDSDFCIRLIEAGRHNWYLSDVELFHLEAQSYRTEFRVADVYNAWLQTHLWDDRIEQIMRAQAAESDSRLMLVESR